VARVSDINTGLYRTFVSPIVKSLTTQTSADFLREMHPNRVAFRAFSDQNPLMAPVPSAAEKIRADRHPVEANNPFLALEKMASSWIVTNLEIFAKTRGAMTEAMFLGTYGSPLVQAAIGLKAEHSDAGRAIERDLATRSKLEADMCRGGFLDAGLRTLLYVLHGAGADERQFNALEALRNRAPESERLPLSQLKDIMRRQATLLRSNEKKAISTISKLLPDDPEARRRTLLAINDVISAAGELDSDEATRFENIKRLFGMAELTQPKPIRGAATNRA
jgi:hypothetical protein